MVINIVLGKTILDVSLCTATVLYIYSKRLKKISLIIILALSTFFCFSQNTDTLYINYFPHSPFSFNEASGPKGLEIEIINEYVAWLKSKKKMNIPVKYNSFSDFSTFYGQIRKSSKNTIGLGSTTISAERLKEVDFTTGYLKNVAFCVTNGNVPDIKTKNPDEIVKVLGSMTALTIDNTSLNRYVNDIKKTYVQDLKVAYQPDETKILDEISKNVLNFGYLDAVGFWFYLKNNPRKFLKMQKILNQSKEELGFVLPKGSQHKLLFNEFFNGPAGFKNSKTYREILEKYLGTYMTQNMAIN